MADSQERSGVDASNFLEPAWLRPDSEGGVSSPANDSAATSIDAAAVAVDPAAARLAGKARAVNRAPGGRPAARDEDASLVARARAGERWAEDAIYRRHAPLITRLCSRLLRHTADTDDVVQDTFLVAFDKLDKLRQPSALRAWLVRIAVHGSRRKLRKRKLLALCGLGESDTDLLLAYAARDHSRPDLSVELDCIERAIAFAPSDHRAAWLLHRVEALSIVETAEAVQRSVATVKRHVAAVDALVERAVGGSHG